MSEYIIRTTNMPEHVREAISTWYDITNEVVRCRDCKHWATESRFTGMCIGKQFNPDGFCAWGERRERC